ncbi:MAG TPA: GAF domain-containing protein [Gemmatimonadaceae bacterium]|nr:GAF domain-containing protein [Gemmatimonadaceae bacterium]
MTITEVERKEDAPQEHTDDRMRALEARIAELERERSHLVAIVDILQVMAASPHFSEILQAIAHNLGRSFGLDRCSIFLSGDEQHVRVVASYEDPRIRNLIVDLNRYPELKRAFDSGETVFIPDAASDPMLQGVQVMLGLRNVRSIVVVPIRWHGTVIGAIFLRSERDAAPFSDRDLTFCQVVASLTASALRKEYERERV